jgi:hypothetical protein
MRKYIYIPVNSLNINNILSTESISPSSFYEKRGFGFKRFEKLTSCPFNNIYLGYDSIPIVPEERSDREEYPIYIAVPEDYLQNKNIVKTDNNLTIFVINSTVYLNSNECFFIVRTDEEKKKLTASSKRSLEAKNSEAYFQDLATLDDYNFNKFNWSENIISGVRDEKFYNDKSIKEDQKINKLKGLLFGYVSGALKEEPTELTRGKRYFQEFINTYSVLMNELSLISKNYGSSKSNFKSKVKSELNDLIDLKERISLLFGGSEVEELNKEIRESFKLDSTDLTKYETIFFKKTRTSIYSLISDFVKSKHKNLYSVDELLESLIQKIQSYLNYRSENSYKEIERLYDSIRIQIQGKIADYENQSIKENSLDNLPFEIQSNFSIKSKINNLKRTVNEDYNFVINELLSRVELSSSDEIAQQRKDIIISIGKDLANKTNNKDEPELVYLRKFHKSIQTVGVGFKLDDYDNKALQAMVCFLSRYNQVDKFQDFMEKNNYANYSLAYGCWGAGYGYANMSKIMIQPIMANQDANKVLNQFIFNLTNHQKLDYNLKDNFINSYKTPKKDEIKSYTYKWDLNKSNKEKESESSKEYLKLKSFSDILENNNILGKNIEWLNILNKVYEEIKLLSGSGGIFTDSNYQEEEFKRILKIKVRNLKGFGIAKEKVAIKLFKNYLANNE